MKDLMKSYYKSSLITSLVLIIVGLLLLLKSSDTIILLSYVIGSILMVLGVVGIVTFFKESSMNIFNNLNIIYGIVSIVLGILIVVNPKAIATFIPFVVGIGILINSAIKLTYSLEAKNNNDTIWKSSTIMSIISAICGIIILFNPFQTSLAVFKIIGAFIVIYAVVDIFYMVGIKKEVKKVDNMIENTIIEAEATIVEKEETIKNKKSRKATTKNNESRKGSIK